MHMTYFPCYVFYFRQVSETDGLLDGDDAAEKAREKVQYFVYHKTHPNPCTPSVSPI